MTGILQGSAPLWLAWTAALFGVGAAAYTAFLFAQAKGRDLWQSPFFLWHLLVQAAVAGSAVLLVGSSLISGGDELLEPLARVFAVSLILDSALMLGEVFLPHASEEARRAADILKHGALASRFWAFAVGAGALLPLLLTLVFPDLAETRWLSSFLALAGLWIFEDLWMKAGQAVPLS
jgi:Ni/Fe-hydrogenase subunit HybB-like protein